MTQRARRVTLLVLVLLLGGVPAGLAFVGIVFAAIGSSFGRGDAAFVIGATLVVIVGLFLLLGVYLLLWPRTVRRALIVVAGAISLCCVGAVAWFWRHQCIVTRGRFNAEDPSCAVLTPVNVIALVYTVGVAACIVMAWRASTSTAPTERLARRRRTWLSAGLLWWGVPLVIPAVWIVAIFAVDVGRASNSALAFFLAVPAALVVTTIFVVVAAFYLQPRISGRLCVTLGSAIACAIIGLFAVKLHGACRPMPGLNAQIEKCPPFTAVDGAMAAYALGMVVAVILAWRVAPAASPSARSGDPP